jgi:hypothetical protein
MDRQQLIEMAKKAGFTIEAVKTEGTLIIEGDGGMFESTLKNFADLVAEDEREACANKAKALIDPALETVDGDPLGEYLRAEIMRSNERSNRPASAGPVN